MSRYFLEVAYKGTAFSGFQVQQNANTVQAEIEKAFAVLQREAVVMTGSSRTDAGVHALQNFFHFDFDSNIDSHFRYRMNAILPGDIVVKSVLMVSDKSHCRFDALTREYEYVIYNEKNPFIQETAYFFPYTLDFKLLQEAAALVKSYQDFTSFSKRNTQAKTFQCSIIESAWTKGSDRLIYTVKANRFLRGMVRALVATMLKVGRQSITIDEFKAIIEEKDCTKASFAVPGRGLTLKAVEYPISYFGG